MKLTAEAVDTLIKECLFHDGEDTSNMVKVEGIVRDFGFHPGRLEANKEKIRELLMELPDEFLQSKGGGWTFLNACLDRAGNQWGEHPSMEALMVLGIGAGLCRLSLPRDMWKVLPGNMPYFTVLDQQPQMGTA